MIVFADNITDCKCKHWFYHTNESELFYFVTLRGKLEAMRKIFTLICCFTSFCQVLLAQPGTVDLMFNTGMGFNNGSVYSIALQPDGKIIAAGNFTSYNSNTANNIARLNENGNFDATFNTGTGFDNIVYSVVVQPDGKIIAAGAFDSYNGTTCGKIIRINTDGSVDNTFNTGSGFSNEVYALALQPDGKILAGGAFSLFNGSIANRVVRVTSSGNNDNLNIGTGIDGDYVKTIALQDDGKIMLGGRFGGVDGIEEHNHTRLNQDGSWDNTYYMCNGFNGNVNSIAIQDDGKMLVAGQFLEACWDTVNYISRHYEDSHYDTTFFPQLNFNNGYPNVIAVDHAGKILVGGSFTQNMIARLHYNGLIDNTFLTTTDFNNSVLSIVVQPDGKILVGGDFAFYNGEMHSRIIRLNGDDFNLHLQNIQHANCSSGTGFVVVEATGGEPPYNYVWNTTPATTGDSVGGLNHGIYSVTATDNSGQSVEGAVLVSGPDVNANIDFSGHFIPTSVFRPGVESGINLHVSNIACEAASGTLKFVLPPILSFIYSSPAPDAFSNDTLIWNLPALNYYDNDFSGYIQVRTNESAQVGDTVCLKMMIFPMEEDGDNIINMCYPVVNSYDPNIKSVYPQGLSEQGFIANNQKMYYYIQFQNTGNAEAININVIDTLDGNLNLETLRILGSSHTMELDIIFNRVLKFRFDNINLPDSTSNEEDSHGYIMYEIEQNHDLPLFTEIKNTAYIYFDYNEPVITNTTLNTIRNTTSINDYDLINLSIYPNPATTHLTIEMNSQYRTSNNECRIMNTMGQVVLHSIFDIQHSTFDISFLSPGLYLLQVFDAKGALVKTEKVVKE